MSYSPEAKERALKVVTEQTLNDLKSPRATLKARVRFVEFLETHNIVKQGLHVHYSGAKADTTITLFQMSQNKIAKLAEISSKRFASARLEGIYARTEGKNSVGIFIKAWEELSTKIDNDLILRHLFVSEALLKDESDQPFGYYPYLIEFYDIEQYQNFLRKTMEVDILTVRKGLMLTDLGFTWDEALDMKDKIPEEWLRALK